MQLVTNGIKLLDSAKDRWIGKDEVREKFGVTPEQVIEVMGLMGDAVDNIPGVKGIGEKDRQRIDPAVSKLENLFDTSRRHGEDENARRQTDPADSRSGQRASLFEPGSRHGQTRRAYRDRLCRELKVTGFQSGKNPHPVYRIGIYQPHQAHRKRRLMGRYRQQAKYSNRCGRIV